MPVVKVEAKLTAPFAPGQLRSYAAHLTHRLDGLDLEGVVVVLVPSTRLQSTEATVRADFDFDGSPPWRAKDLNRPAIAFCVLSWDELLSTLGRIDQERFRNELEQFEGMYRELGSLYIAPLADRQALIDWRNREDVFVKLVDAVTRHLTESMTSQPRVYPLYIESSGELTVEGVAPRGHTLRYVCPIDGPPKPACFSIGVRDPFAGYVTPIWMRFHKGTGNFRELRDRLQSSHVTHGALVESEGHIWFPLDVPLGADQAEMIRALISQAQAIWRIAFPSQAQ